MLDEGNPPLYKQFYLSVTGPVHSCIPSQMIVHTNSHSASHHVRRLNYVQTFEDTAILQDDEVGIVGRQDMFWRELDDLSANGYEMLDTIPIRR